MAGGLIVKALKEFGERNPNMLASLGAKLGLGNGASVRQIGTKLANSKAAQAIAYTANGVALSELGELLFSDPEVRNQIEAFDYRPDTASQAEIVGDLGKFQEEFDVIQNAIDALGGTERFLNVYNALLTPRSTVQKFLVFRSAASRYARGPLY